MRKNLFAGFLFSSLLVVQTRAQESIPKPTYLETYLSAGGIAYLAPTLLLTDAGLLVPNSTILKGDLSRFTRNIGYSGMDEDINQNHNPLNSSMMAGASFDMQVGNYGLFGKEKKRLFQMRIGISYSTTQSVGSYWYNEDKTPYDTLISTGNGSKIITDSVFEETLDVSYSSNQVKVNADWMLHTNPDRWFSMYAGVGFSAGATFNNQTQLYYTTQTFITTGDGDNQNTISSSAKTEQNEWNNNKAGWMLGGYVPLGFNLRLGKTKPVLNQTSLFLELRTGLTVFAITEIQTYLLPYFQSNFGLRIRF